MGLVVAIAVWRCYAFIDRDGTSWANKIEEREPRQVADVTIPRPKSIESPHGHAARVVLRFLRTPILFGTIHEGPPFRLHYLQHLMSMKLYGKPKRILLRYTTRVVIQENGIT